jgi:hypothetical protein
MVSSLAHLMMGWQSLTMWTIKQYGSLLKVVLLIDMWSLTSCLKQRQQMPRRAVIFVIRVSNLLATVQRQLIKVLSFPLDMDPHIFPQSI